MMPLKQIREIGGHSFFLTDIGNGIHAVVSDKNNLVGYSFDKENAAILGGKINIPSFDGTREAVIRSLEITEDRKIFVTVSDGQTKMRIQYDAKYLYFMNEMREKYLLN